MVTLLLFNKYFCNEKYSKKKAKKIFLLNNIYEIENSLNEIDNSFDLNIYLSQLIDLRKKIKSIYSNELTEGNSKKALEELEQRLIGGSRIKHIKLIFFYIGVIITSFLFFISLNYIKPVQEYSFIPFFPAYNFFFIIVEVMIGISINMVILRKYKINYIYIFEIVPNSRLGSTEMFQNAFLLLSIWLSSLKSKSSISIITLVDKSIPNGKVLLVLSNNVLFV